jgi:hypothetical protein
MTGLCYLDCHHSPPHPHLTSLQNLVVEYLDYMTTRAGRGKFVGELDGLLKAVDYLKQEDGEGDVQKVIRLGQ